MLGCPPVHSKANYVNDVNVVVLCSIILYHFVKMCFRCLYHQPNSFCFNISWWARSLPLSESYECTEFNLNLFNVIEKNRDQGSVQECPLVFDKRLISGKGICENQLKHRTAVLNIWSGFLLLYPSKKPVIKNLVKLHLCNPQKYKFKRPWPYRLSHKVISQSAVFDFYEYRSIVCLLVQLVLWSILR